MAVPTIPTAISLTNIQTEFGGANPISINEYYSGGTYVGAGKANSTSVAIPSSGTISFANFSGAIAFVPVTHTYDTGTNATETVPTGAVQVVITIWGGGGSGGSTGFNSTSVASGGGGGGYSTKTIAVTGGNTLTYNVGQGGAGITASTGNFRTVGSTGGASNVSATVSGGSVSMNCNGGGGGGSGTAGGGGGTATGGTTNTTGTTGGVEGTTAAAQAGTASYGGGSPNGGTNAVYSSATGFGTAANPPGGGSSGISGANDTSSENGGTGRISFAYT